MHSPAMLGNSSKGKNMRIAYISQGKLFVKDEDKKASEVESEFGRNIVETAVKIAQKHEWKNKGAGAQFRGTVNPWGGSAVGSAEQTRVHFSAVSRGQGPSGLSYALDTDDIGGLFRLSGEQNSELRIFHRQDININHIDQHLKKELLLCDITSPGGTCDIYYMKGKGRLEQLTEGDSVDMAPSWIPGEEESFIYQSAGVGRNAEGYVMGLGPFSIEKLSLSGTLSTLKDDESFDFLLPHIDSEGKLYFIKRPYEHPNSQSKASPVEILKDIIFFPFRLLQVFFAFFNFLSLMLTGKGLTRAQGPKQDDRQEKVMWLMGRVVDTQKTLKENQRKGNQSIVPKNWELICQRPDGTEKTIAQGVVSFDIGPNNEVLYSDGTRVFKIEGQNESVLFEDKMIQQVAIV